MKIELPGWLLDLAEELATQDNLATASPLFEVREQVIYPAPDGYGDGWGALDDEGDWLGCRATVPELDDAFGSAVEVVRVWMHERVVTTCLTRKAAEAYIEGNKHNLANPSVYVASAHRNHEMINLTNWLKGVAK